METETARAAIAAAATGGRLHHAMLLTGDGEKGDLLRFAAAAYQCEAEGQRPCLRCPACRKVMQDIHPDVTQITAEANKKDISVEAVRAVRADAYIRPNEGRCKVYVFPNVPELTEKDQNAILKLVEEGPAYAAFVFSAPSESDMLTTLRSRCVVWHTEEDGDEAEDAAATECCRLLGSGDKRAVLFFLLRLSAKRMKPEETLHFIRALRTMLIRALVGRYRGTHFSAPSEEIARLEPEKTVKLIETLREAAEDTEYNISGGLLLGALAAKWEEIL